MGRHEAADDAPRHPLVAAAIAQQAESGGGHPAGHGTRGPVGWPGPQPDPESRLGWPGDLPRDGGTESG